MISMHALALRSDQRLAHVSEVRHAAGGRKRLLGELAVSRSLGDLPYRAVGLIAEPDIREWRAVQPWDSFLILASDAG